MLVYHIADLHIRSARADEYRDVFDLFIAAVRETPPDVVAILGDVFTSKTTVRPEEISLFCYLCKKIMDLGVRVVLIPGNHDANMNNPDSTDLLSPIVHEAFADNAVYRDLVYFYPRTGVYRAAGIDWVVYSCIDHLQPASDTTSATASATASVPRVALVHETISGCRLDNGMTWDERTRLAVYDLEPYTCAMLGDIHKMQFMLPHVAYAGSMLQQNIGEHPVDHGYIAWTIPATGKATGVFHRIVNRAGAMVKIYFKNDAIVDPIKLSNVQRCDVVWESCTPEFIGRIQSVIHTKYNVNVTRVVERWTPAALEPVTSENETMLALTQWMSSNALADDTCASVLAEHARYGAALDDARVGRGFKLVYIEWSNMLGYGGDKLNWINFTGVLAYSKIGINGKNRSGKSSIIDIISVTLFGEPLRGHVRDVLHRGARHSRSRAVVHGGDGAVYVITRCTDKNRNQSVTVTRDNITVTRETITLTYQYLSTVVGRHRDFVNITCQLQDQSTFTTMSALDQTRYIYEVLGIGQIPDIIKTVQARVRELKTQRRCAIARSVVFAERVLEPVQIDEPIDPKLAVIIENKLRRLGTEIARPVDYSADALVSETLESIDAWLLEHVAVPRASIAFGTRPARITFTAADELAHRYNMQRELVASPGVHVAGDTRESLARAIHALPVPHDCSREHAITRAECPARAPDTRDEMSELVLLVLREQHVQPPPAVACTRAETVHALAQLPEPAPHYTEKTLADYVQKRRELHDTSIQFRDDCSACQLNLHRFNNVDERARLDTLVREAGAELQAREQRVRLTNELELHDWHDAYRCAQQTSQSNARVHARMRAVEYREWQRASAVIQTHAASSITRAQLIARAASLELALALAAREHSTSMIELYDSERSERVRDVNIAREHMTRTREHLVYAVYCKRRDELKQLKSRNQAHVTQHALWSNVQRDTKTWTHWQEFDTEVEHVDLELARLTWYQRAIDTDTGFPRVLLALRAQRVRALMTSTIAAVTVDVFTLSDTFAIEIAGVPVELASGFQRSIVNLALRVALINTCQVPCMKDVMWIDETLVGSCDDDHQHKLIHDLLPNIKLGLYIITHHEPLQNVMHARIDIVDQHVEHGEPYERECTADDPPGEHGDSLTNDTLTCTTCSRSLANAGMMRRHLASATHLKKAASAVTQQHRTS